MDYEAWEKDKESILLTNEPSTLFWSVHTTRHLHSEDQKDYQIFVITLSYNLILL